MKNFQFRFILSVISLASILMAATASFAAPVRLNQVVELVNAKPGKAATGSFSQLRMADDLILSGDDDDTTATTQKQQDDPRMITDTRTEIVEDDVCDCEQSDIVTRSFPYWALGFAAVPLLFLIPPDKKKTPTPTVTMTTTPTETPITPTPTKTPPTTVTPTPPEPVPEPMTILLFGTGLAGIGVAARKKFGKKEKKENEE